MDIITAVSPAAPVAAQAAPDDSAIAGEATPFDAVLQQVQSADSEPVVPVEVTPAPSVEVAESPAPVVQEQPLLAQPEIPEVASEPIPAVPEPEPEQASQPPPPAEVTEALPVDADVAAPALVALQAGDEVPGDDLAIDDETEQGADSLEAIRQRLELIDTAGLMASGALVVTPPVAWAQPAGASPEPEVERGAGDSLETATDTYLPVDNAIEAAVATEVQPEDGVIRKSDGQFSLTSDWDLAALPNASALTVLDNGNDATPPVIASTVGSDEWQSDLGQQLLGMVRRGDRQVDMQLHPADLGPLSISLNVSDSGVQAQFQSAHAAVRAAVEQALPQLQSALASQGLTLGEASVNDGASRQAMGEQPRRESPGGEAREQRVVQVEKPVQVQQVATSGAGVDLYL
ncbi:flagellar hook-length control protein FliK [Pseudomonas sp. CC120222-01a]|uniref:flagellar hook-length control protein FliK n=1 Tax=Pseudomonas sp. CC120222-01a TaxID=1378075 RepID=UPI000D820A32|nr:flagellar hook-length control protein FliK [Pseudomonas sp. CC120222-01a]PVZ40338.1 flagellar hook-length control protein FliK [Pseudomonas sp. CC120222-01a]